MSALGQKQTCAVREGMSALPPKADMCGATRDVRFGPKADIEPRRLGAWYRQNRHDLHGISRKDRKVRMLLEQLGGSVMRFRANDRVGTHRVAYVFDAALAHRGPPTPMIAARCFSTPAFQAAIPSCVFACRASSERAFQAAMRALVLLPRKMPRNASFVFITSPFV